MHTDYLCRETKLLTHLKLIISLFFIMGMKMLLLYKMIICVLMLGVPWLLDVISFAITEKDQTTKSIEIVLDLVNLLSVRNTEVL